MLRPPNYGTRLKTIMMCPEPAGVENSVGRGLPGGAMQSRKVSPLNS
jgi:hypothetical protein